MGRRLSEFAKQYAALGSVPSSGVVNLGDWRGNELARNSGKIPNAQTPLAAAIAKHAHSQSFVWGDTMTSPDNLKPSEWVVYKVLPTECTAMIYGGWGTCKTFLLIDLFCCIANGIPWHGRATKQGTVFILAGEGEGGFARRLKAWELGNGGTSKNIAFSEMPNLRDGAQLGDVIGAIETMAAERGEPRAIAIDTLFTALHGGDENSGKDMGELLTIMRELRQRFRCAVVVVHHTGHEGERARGHSSVPSGVDVQFFVKAKTAQDGSGLVLELANPKQKDGSKTPPMLLTTETVELPGLIDADGVTESSLVIRAPIVAMQAAAEERSLSLAAIKAKALEMRASGLTFDQIATYVGRNKSTVSRWFDDS